MNWTRRHLLCCGAKAVLAGSLFPRVNSSRAQVKKSATAGAIIGEPAAARVGHKVLASGGNAVDAAVTAALAAGVASPHNCGPGGYGGHMVLYLSGEKKLTAIDFNSAAPRRARADMFVDADGTVRSEAHNHGWLAAGVPGTLAGMQLALERYGTLSLREALAPSIQIARDGFTVDAGFSSALKGSARHWQADPASARLFSAAGGTLAPGDRFQNPELAEMLTQLAKENSAASFYRGEIGRRIAAQFAKQGGLVTIEDLADYQAKEVIPLKLAWGSFEIFTAPLTAGGLTVLEALSILKELKWPRISEASARNHARLEALRVAWQDRLRWLGDPEHSSVPVARLLSSAYAKERGDEIRSAIRDRRPLGGTSERRDQPGTVHLSCADRQGNLAALTLTHGGSFGACVTVEGLGLVLGHGMSRFEAKPGHPNSPAPGKRPLHNMCPTIVLREGRPALALGGAGGRRIPNAVFDVILHYTVLGRGFEDAMEAPRLHGEGGLEVRMERRWAKREINSIRALGFEVTIGGSAKVSAVSFDPGNGECRAASR